MEFLYPNLLRNSRKRFQYLSNGIKSIGSVAMRDGVVGDYQRVTLDVDSKDWAYLYIFGIDDVGDVPEGTEIVISCFARVNDGPCSLTPTIRRGDGTHALHQGDTTTRKNVGGGWTLCVTRAQRNATAYDVYQQFHIGLAPDKAGTTIDVAQPAVFIGTTPHAWAPAEGESLAGGGALMSANLLDGVETVSGRRIVDGFAWPGFADPGNCIARVACVVGETYTLYVDKPNGGEVCFGFFSADGSFVSRPRGYQCPPSGKPYTDVEVAPEGAAWVAASWASGIATPVLTAGGVLS